jgi:uncharacterized protein
MQLFPKALKKVVYAAFRAVGVALVVALVVLFFVQERLIFPGSKLPSDHVFHFNLPFEEKVLSSDGLRIDSLLFHAPSPKGLILYFHGNGGDLNSWGRAGEEIAERVGMDVWMIDYPGYGKSEGTISSEQQLHNIAKNFFEAANPISSGKIVIYGRSIGTGIATKLASENQVAALVLESPYFSFDSVVREKMPWVPLFLLKYTFQSQEWIKRVRSPVLVFHGENDEVIPFHQGKELAGLLPQSVFVSISSAHHNDISAHPQYWSALGQFISALN